MCGASITVYSLNVCLHIHVWEDRTLKKVSIHTSFILSPQLPSSCQASQIKPAVWWLSLTRCRMLWQAPVTVVRQELNLRPLSVSSRHKVTCGVKKAFSLFPDTCYWCWVYRSLWRALWLKDTSQCDYNTGEVEPHYWFTKCDIL